MKKTKILVGYFSFILAFLLSGCSSMVTSTEQYIAIDKLVAKENYTEAASVFAKGKEEHFDAKDRVLYWLDAGLLNHYALQDSLAIINLQKADFGIEELFTTSISKGAASMLLNDNALDYSGEDYENLYINVFKALSYYRNGSRESALVEIRRLIEKFVVLENNFEEEINLLNNSKEIQGEVENISINFYSSALAHYISMILFYNDHDYDDARISKEKLYAAFDNQKELYNFAKPNLDSLLERGAKSKLAFLSFLGRAPQKYEYIFSIDTYKDLIVISVKDNMKWTQYSSMHWYGVEGGLHAKFAVPKMKKRGSIVTKIEVNIDGKHKKDLYKLESLEDVAFETFKRDEAIIYLKSITRTVTKAIANEALNDELDKQTGGDGWGSLTRIISGALINATENADLRIAHYFPAFAFAGEVEVEPGIHNIEIIYKDALNRTIEIDTFENYNVTNKKKINLIETVFLH